MDSSARQSYIETQVMTATPQRLRLMLIEGAIRFASQGLQHAEADRQEDAREAISRCRAIVTELLSSVKHGTSEVTRDVAAVYVYLFRALTEAQLHEDTQKLQDVISVLEVERETWQQLCEQMPQPPEANPADQIQEVTASDASKIEPMFESGGSSFDSSAVPHPMGSPIAPSTERTVTSQSPPLAAPFDSGTMGEAHPSEPTAGGFSLDA